MDVIDELEQHLADRQLSLLEAMEKYDVVGANYDPVHGSYIIMADREPGMSAVASTRELGYASPSPFTAWTREERVGALRDKQGTRTYYDMKRADGTVRGALRMLKTPIMAGRWFVEPATDKTVDKTISDFVEDNLFNKLNVPWTRVVEDALLMCEYGYIALEKVYSQDNDGKLRLKKLAPRHPLDVNEWVYDANGGPKALIMEATEANGFDKVVIPIEKLVVFVLEQEAGDMRGISVLRSAYKHYQYKDTMYKIDAIQKERHGIGIPIIKLPLGFSEADRKTAEDLGRNLRTNERAHIVTPANWEVAFAKLEGQPVDCLNSIKHHDDRIMINILAPFYDDPGTKDDSMGMFFKSTRYIASTLVDTINRFVIPQLVDFNFTRGGYPKLRVRRIGELEDQRTMSFAVRNYVGAGIIRPDDELEKFVRVELDLPPVDEKTVREVQTPQNPQGDQQAPNNQDPTMMNQTNNVQPPTPPAVGMPRQATNPPVGPGRQNTGIDKSGGKK